MMDKNYGTVRLYRDDSVTPVEYENVKHVFMTAGNTVLTIAQVTDVETGAHRYIHWPRERFCWYTYDKPVSVQPEPKMDYV
jgi:hypothetical protein